MASKDKEKAKVKAQQKAKAQKVRAQQKADKRAKNQKTGVNISAPDASALPTSTRSGNKTSSNPMGLSRGVTLKG